MKAVDIKWDIDHGDDVVLPTEIDIPEDIVEEAEDLAELEDRISDYISDLTGYCHKGFYVEGLDYDRL